MVRHLYSLFSQRMWAARISSKDINLAVGMIFGLSKCGLGDLLAARPQGQAVRPDSSVGRAAD